MKPRWAALLVVLALLVGVSASADAQSTTPRRPAVADSAAVLPPVTTQAERQMTFSVGDAPNCSERGRLYKVSLRVYNVLAQLVAVPTLKDDERRDDDKPLENVLLSCDEYTAYWDGRNANTSQNAAPGIYLYQLEVDGRPVQVKRVIIKK